MTGTIADPDPVCRVVAVMSMKVCYEKNSKGSFRSGIYPVGDRKTRDVEKRHLWQCGLAGSASGFPRLRGGVAILQVQARICNGWMIGQ